MIKPLLQYVRENAEVVKHGCSVRDGGEQPVQVLLINALGKEGNDSKKPLGIRTKLLEHW